MRLSVLMPTHERPETLRLAMASVRRQEFEDWELLVCGDGCGAETEAVMAEACRTDERIRWFPLPKAPGFGYANRNLVLQQARGELIGFAAHDNLVFTDHWARLVACFDDPDLALASSSAAWIDDAGRLIPTIFNLADRALRARFIATTHNRMPANAFVYRRALHDTVGMWDPTLDRRGDLDLWSRILRHAGEGAFCYLPVVSFLHFRGLWKAAAGIGDPQEEGVWPRLFAEPGRLPPALTLPVPSGVLPQQAAFERLHGPEGGRWQDEVRAACALALESNAWECEVAWMAERKAALKLEQTVARREAEIAELKQALRRRPTFWQRLAARLAGKPAGPS